MPDPQAAAPARLPAELVDGPIDMQRVMGAVGDAASGATVLFLGRVRNNRRGRPVGKLTYDGYRPMAQRALERIVVELEKAAPGLRLAIVHRLGAVPVGEPSIAIAASSPHRAAAYKASRTALERLKREVPIWKREHYLDGESAWREEESLAP